MAEGDVTLLVGRLTSYSEALERHTAAIQRAFEKVQESYANLHRVYGGAAADDVHTHWRVTTEALERYLEGSRRIKETLDARLASLREADLPMGGGAMRHRSLAPPQQGAGLGVALRADTSHVFRSPGSDDYQWRDQQCPKTLMFLRETG